MKSDTQKLTFNDFKSSVLRDYKIACTSREMSLMGRREVLSGKGSFGIFGDGKELAQIALARCFKKGDFRSGYYRDQTIMLALNELTVEQFFAALYGHADIDAEPQSGGRQMVAHFSTHSLNDDGSWKNLNEQYNSASDISCTAGQMPRLVGLAQASKIFRKNKLLKEWTNFSCNGDEIAWGTIGNASTSEGHFFEAINAAGVLQIPMVISVWDDGYGISVDSKHQTTKENISEILNGFQRNKKEKGIEILKVNGWDYPALIETYEKAEKIARKEHVPVLIHVTEMTQPQGHSTSGSHERYKSKERLEWEKDYDCLELFKKWLIDNSIASNDDLTKMRSDIKKEVSKQKNMAWKAFQKPILEELNQAVILLDKLIEESPNGVFIKPINDKLKFDAKLNPYRKNIFSAIRSALRIVRGENTNTKSQLKKILSDWNTQNQERYSSHLHSKSEQSILKVKEISPTYNDQSKEVDARVILRDNFEQILADNPEVLIFGEDSGQIGGVNQGLEGLQKKFGELRVSDTGIREATILGQGIGLAMRGLRPIAEIQYLDYLLYCFQGLSDDLATLHYRTKGKQKAPLIVRTRGHRLEGIWHSGSPLGMLLNGLRGINVLVPRNMTKAAGFYNTLMASDEPGIVIECLNGYRLKEKIPSNLGVFTTAVGIPEITKIGSDITIVTYGSTWKIVSEAAKELEKVEVSCEVIDVQSLLPFDINHSIVDSLKKTNKVVFIDEDVSSGATAYMMQKVLEEQKGYFYLDSEPKTISAKDHRPAYGEDGDYFSKPNIDDIFENVYAVMHNYNPTKYPKL
ncbi:MAG: transketolase [Flavobacteriales bacterium]|nr:transketolase [Flavobacteriales bacterium]|tara:strand:- start:2673 stop:5081 length:2409 start_codon:yes stop_codon:yes gene_type:complete